MHRYRLLGGALLVAAALLVPASAASAAAACTWRPTALPVPGRGGLPTATDHQGGFAGVADTADGQRPIAWKNGAYSVFSGIGDRLGYEVASENRAGTIVGTARVSFPGVSVSRAFRSRGDVLEELPKLGNNTKAAALGINDAGDITGYVWGDSSGLTTVVRWPAAQPGTVTALPGLAPDPTQPQAVDEDGSVLLLRDSGLAIWRAGTITRLGTLPGLRFPAGRAFSNGRVAGDATYNDKKVGVYWDQQGAAHVLPKSSYNLSNGNPQIDINRDGLITGRIDEAHGGNDSNGTGYGVWQQGAWVSNFGDITRDLPSRIGDDGTVAGARADSDGTYHPYTWRCS
ncbi:hypothetical protein [Amycolatopsis rubida]|uniref:Extracellular repeat, HAF family n=1 Tax=Amycolatopsis rubida TaxID=112413 RepID=A0A1I5HRZ2_9PSEU|nr:hypothetical protein [Amycolatopsis rubida]SFO50666.1 hypothetical protein SAMN05421854_10222 [Amycolatopsis rubida]